MVNFKASQNENNMTVSDLISP